MNKTHWFQLKKNHTSIKQGKSEGFESCDRPSNLTQIGLKSSIVHPCDLEIWWMTLKNNKAHLLYNIKLCVSFHIHQWIQNWSYSPETPNLGQIRWFFLAVWPCNLTYDLEKQQGTSLMLLQALCIISQPSVISNWRYSPEMPNLGQNQQFLELCDLEIWRMTLKNNRAPLLSNIKLCATFHHHMLLKLELRSGNG